MMAHSKPSKLTGTEEKVKLYPLLYTALMFLPTFQTFIKVHFSLPAHSFDKLCDNSRIQCGILDHGRALTASTQDGNTSVTPWEVSQSGHSKVRPCQNGEKIAFWHTTANTDTFYMFSIASQYNL